MKREGFTLIELLVVISVIALTIAVLLPALRFLRLQAGTIVCSSNIRQLVSYLTMYEQGNGTFPHAFDDTLRKPPHGGFPGNPLYDRFGWWWFNHIIDYSRKDTGKDTILWCPSREINDIRLKDNVLCGNYGANLSICKRAGSGKSHTEFFGTPLSSIDIPNPSQTLLIIDSGYSMISWRHVTDFPPEPLGNFIADAAYVPGLEINKKKILWPGLEWDATNSRHPNKTVNIGFSDGHVNRNKADDLFVEKTETGYKNRYPLWRPTKNNND